MGGGTGKLFLLWFAALVGSIESLDDLGKRSEFQGQLDFHGFPTVEAFKAMGFCVENSGGFFHILFIPFIQP